MLSFLKKISVLIFILSFIFVFNQPVVAHEGDHGDPVFNNEEPIDDGDTLTTPDDESVEPHGQNGGENPPDDFSEQPVVPVPEPGDSSEDDNSGDTNENDDGDNNNQAEDEDDVDSEEGDDGDNNNEEDDNSSGLIITVLTVIVGLALVGYIIFLVIRSKK